ncbi:DUF4238 domain-containing protein [Xanthomonas campestris pv. campestris]|jgi:hypothetical protein|uniref:DUF4238 domain-containing protein n=1 Tax=Xanthomonas campestris pv. campestris (strain B100) TaxID=509169 RepID=B0RL96_XANCB|nr:DUF4238 domain-containing protein [Xanthomonas campestris]MCD0248922.1 DUF4238 domain-containing protein [Xanthomonas campestris pv. campestris]MCD0252568.1 DUF4238 domain-containing protein [Xanthomonas campestris pv. campestris]MCD0261678.1 DUF4238 domain-containing protein [Xanthomonas campestris pv. campestris]MCD0269806.1 DUF4238 domain-containing protein [Xanthomonas campestris pv. campestris]MCD0277148.1 DUF4238 domain-containing protein [Xanthomonas campestris pv. campestris]
MAGRRQHYLPRFLQRPFRYRASDKQDYVHAHESTRSYTPSTMGLGQERDFYGSAAESSADDNVTESENRLSEILNRLNTESCSVSQGDQALLVAALAVRTNKMRKSLEAMVRVFANEMADLLQKYGVRQREIEVYWSDKSKLEAMIQEELKKMPPMPREIRTKVISLIKQQWHGQRDQIIFQMQVGVKAIANEVFKRMDQESAHIADSAFRKVFEADPTIPQRVASLTEHYEFSVITACEGEEFILGDCAAVGFRADRSPRLPIGDLDNDSPLDQIYLPISPTRCIAAMRKGTSTWAQMTDINEASAALSHRFFISKSSEPANLTKLQSLIGVADPLASEEDMRSLLKKIYGTNRD